MQTFHLLSQIQKDLIVGTLLGDANLQTNAGQTWKYRAIHKSLHYSYIMHKYDILKDYCTSEVSYSEVFDQQMQKTYKRYMLNTVFTNSFRFYGQHFYTKKEQHWKKTIPSDIHKYLTPRAVAFWYMENGALTWKGKSNAVRFCTDSFEIHEIELLKKALEKNFSLKVSRQTKNNICRISIAEESYPILKDLIVEHLHPSMYYKFPDGNKGVYNGDDISFDIVNTFAQRHF